MFGVSLAQAANANIPPITASNWMNHPWVKEIRTIYQAVAALRAAGKLQKSSKTFDYCPAWDLQRVMLEGGEVVRFYKSSGGSDDSAVRMEHTYDAKGRLRFVLVKAGAVNHTHLEYRCYLSETGVILWKDQRVQGPGYAFADFSKYFAFDPKKAFAAGSPCR
jgi:hypothetical protein